MKKVMSISLGSSKRDHKVVTTIMGETFEISRIGTDGDMEAAIHLVEEYDGKVDAFGMGGIDVYLNGGNKKYIIKDAKPLLEAAKLSPMADGTFVKNTLERKVIRYIGDKKIVDFNRKNILLVCGLDRFGMAEELIKSGGYLTFGDAMFSIGWNFPMHSLKILHIVAGIIAPVVCRMPFEMVYPTGKEQDKKNYKFTKYFHENEIIAGDFLYIKKYMPDNMEGKIVITNTVTSKDVDDLKSAGVNMLITTTPELSGRSFGTNVIEGIVVALSGKMPGEMTECDYESLLEKIGFVPRVEYLNNEKVSIG